MQTVLEILRQSWQLVLQSGAFLLVGFLIAGLIHAFVSTARLARWLGPARWRSVLNAAVIGAPLPLCSCSVVPVAATLRKRGASRGATTAFLISTPESGVDSIAVTYALMDPIMTVARPLAAIFSAFAAGIAQNVWGERRAATDQESTPTELETSSCCGEPSACCESSEPAAKAPLRARLTGALRFGLVEMFEDLAVYLVIGFVLAGALAVLLQQFDPLRLALSSAWAPLVMLVAGIPMYVCAASATPMIAVLISGGLSPGAGLVFLLAGPATNAASLVLLQKILGRRSILIYLASIIACALLAGLALDGVYAALSATPHALSRAEYCCTDPSWLDQLAAFALAACVLNGLWRRYRPRWLAARATPSVGV